MSTPFVGKCDGFDSDLPVMEASFAVLKSLGIPFEVRITSCPSHSGGDQGLYCGCGIPEDARFSLRLQEWLRTWPAPFQQRR